MGYEFRDGSRLERRVDGLQVKVHVMWGSHWREGSCCVVVCRQCQLEAVDEWKHKRQKRSHCPLNPAGNNVGPCMKSLVAERHQPTEDIR
eukprot:scaffold1104_cov278-Alexandrium_tamarense.AAC.16